MKKLTVGILLIAISFTGFSQSIEPSEYTLGSVRKNSLYLELAGNGLFWSPVNYDRIIPLSKRMAAVPRVGFTNSDGFNFLYEINFIMGGPHFLEVGFGQIFYSDTFPERDYMIRFGYRYQGRKGLLIRAAPQFFHQYLGGEPQNGPWGAFAIGYCF